jgi:cell division protein FtsI (penicillin-binding protein 3)
MKNIRRNITVKLFVIYGFVALALVSVVIKIMVIQTQDPKKWEGQVISFKREKVEPLRGDICDRDGRILATSIPSYSIHWDFTVPKLMDELYPKNIDSLTVCMSRLFKDKTPKEYKAFFDSARNDKKRHKYYPIKNYVTFTQMNALKKFPIFNRGRYKSGIIIEYHFTRRTPHKTLAERTIGYLNQGGTRVGLEDRYNGELRGKEGEKLMLKLPSSEYYPVSFDGGIEPEDGSDIISTIDVNIQDIAEQSLLKQLKKYKAKHGTVVVMEVKTGKIRAIANLDMIKDSVYKEVINSAVLNVMEPGSTFKLPSLIAVLEKTDISIYDSIDLGDGVFKIYDHVIGDDHPLKGKHTVKEIFEKSSNVGMAKLVYETFKSNSSEFIDRLYQMHLNKPTGIDLNGEGEPKIKYPGDNLWWAGSLAKIAYGYEVALTPLQILTFYNAIANNGVMLRPHLREATRLRGGKKIIDGPVILNSSVCGKETLEKVRILLQGVVENGTAANLKSPYYTIAGKTGTAQIAKGSSGYKDEQGIATHSASFVGYFPAEKPKYSCIVVINSPSRFSYYGGTVAGPVFKEIADKLYSKDYDLFINREFNLERMADVRDVPHSKGGRKEVLDRLFGAFNIGAENVQNAQTTFVYATKGTKGIRLEGFNSRKAMMPDVRGMGLRDALFLLRKEDLDVTVIGRGEVKKQSVAPSTAIKKGMKVTIELG